MSQTIKFPEMRARGARKGSTLPPPSGYRPLVPTFPTSESSPRNRRLERQRLYVWFGAAVALHAALLLLLWLTPPLRLKWGPSPDAWVQVTSLPKELPQVPEPPAGRHAGSPAETALVPALAVPAAALPAAKPKAHKSQARSPLAAPVASGAVR